MQAHFRILALLLLSLFSSQAIATTNDVAISLYNRWERLPSEQLMKMGEQYRNVTRHPDSALVCFSIVANRYYQGHQTRDDIEKAIEAMTHIVWLYMEEFYDYPKAVSYNMQAHELADKHQCYDYRPFILINEANIQSLQFNVENPKDFNNEGIKLMKKAFYAALEQKNWYALNVAFINLMISTTFRNKENLVECEMDIIMNTQIPDSITHTLYSRCLTNAVRTWNNHQPDSAGMYFENLMDIAREHQNPRQKALSQIVANDYLAFYYEETRQDDKAIAAIKDNESIATELNSKVHLIDAYINQMRFYEHMKDTEMAEHYRTLYLEATVSLLTDKKLGNVKETKFLYELNKKNEEVRQMAYREQVKNRVMWGALITAIVLLTLLVLLWLNNRRIREHNRQLYNKSLEMLRADEEKRELIEQLQLSMPIEDEPKLPYAPDETPQREGKLSAARQSDILHRVFMVMETSDEIYSPDFSLPRLAKLVGDTRNNVSEAINLRYQGNFNALVNEYRVKEACRRFNDRAKYGQFTIEAVGLSVGFKSRSAFSTVFKQIVGLTPGAYQRQRKN